MNKKFVYQVGNNKKVILRCTANQISRIVSESNGKMVGNPLSGTGLKWDMKINYLM